MKFQVGDKVKFLNEKGGGVVTKIITSTMVNVMVKEGFEIPTLTSELIKVDPKGKVESMFDEDFGISRQSADVIQQMEDNIQQSAISNQPAANFSNEETDRQSPLGNFSFRAKNSPGVYLAFVPHDQKWLVTGLVEIYLINRTTYNVLFTFFLEEEKEIIGKDYDVIFPNNRILIDTVDRDQILQWTRGIVQLIFHDEQPARIVSPVSTEFDISPSRFNKEENYVFTQFLEEKALLLSISQASALETIISKDESHLSDESVTTLKSQEVKPASLIEKHQTGPRQAVVDLHIEELVDNPKLLDPKDMLKVQMDYFKRCIESAAEQNFQKVTFIHGVGSGVLKSAIIKKINEYEHADTHLASLAKFGVGAIDVLIKPMK
jgi:hypothetical protein